MLEQQTPEYEKLLIKFAADKDIFELIERCILADYADREKEFILKKKYPERRDLIMKLKMDLAFTRNKMIKKGGE